MGRDFKIYVPIINQLVKELKLFYPFYKLRNKVPIINQLVKELKQTTRILQTRGRYVPIINQLVKELKQNQWCIYPR